MNDNSYSMTTRATSDYVLAVLRDEHRQATQFDFACDPDIALSLDCTIADWRAAMDLLPARELGRALNESWGINVSDTEWRSVLAPARNKTLRGVAKLIAKKATRTQIRPLEIAGTRCRPAAAFLAIKDRLAAEDIDVTSVAPRRRLPSSRDITRKCFCTQCLDWRQGRFQTSKSMPLCSGLLKTLAFVLVC